MHSICEYFYNCFTCGNYLLHKLFMQHELKIMMLQTNVDKLLILKKSVTFDDSFRVVKNKSIKINKQIIPI